MKSLSGSKTYQFFRYATRIFYTVTIAIAVVGSYQVIRLGNQVVPNHVLQPISDLIAFGILSLVITGFLHEGEKWAAQRGKMRGE